MFIRRVLKSSIVQLDTKIPQICGNLRQTFENTNKRFYAHQRKMNPHEAKPKEKWVKRADGKINYSNAFYENASFNKNITDSVWLANEHPVHLWSIEQAINFHLETANEVMFNNMDGFLNVQIILNMKLKKKGKYLDGVKGVIKYPHFFIDGIQKEVIAVCKKDEEKAAALEAGAVQCGYTEILQMLERGEINEASYDILVCTTETLPELTLLKKKLKDRLPSLKTKTVGDNIRELVEHFRLSKSYESTRIDDELSVLKLNVGILNMDVNKLSENVRSLLTTILQHSKIESKNFIKSCVLKSPPSAETFLIAIDDVVAEFEKNQISEKETRTAKKETAANA